MRHFIKWKWKMRLNGFLGNERKLPAHQLHLACITSPRKQLSLSSFFFFFFAPFSLTLFLSLYSPSQLTSSTLNSSQQRTSYSVWKTQRVRTCLLIPRQTSEIRCTKCSNMFSGGLFSCCTDRPFTFESLCCRLSHTEGAKKKKKSPQTKTAKKHPGCFHSSRVSRILKTSCC